MAITRTHLEKAEVARLLEEAACLMDRATQKMTNAQLLMEAWEWVENRTSLEFALQVYQIVYGQDKAAEAKQAASDAAVWVRELEDTQEFQEFQEKRLQDQREFRQARR